MFRTSATRRTRRDRFTATGFEPLEGRQVLSTVTLPHPLPVHPRLPAPIRPAVADVQTVMTAGSQPFNLKLSSLAHNPTGRDYVSGRVDVNSYIPRAGEIHVRIYWTDGKKRLGLASTSDSVQTVRAGNAGSIGFHFQRSDLTPKPSKAVQIEVVVDPDNLFAESNEKDNSATVTLRG
ncbi:MAG: CARDB domain-containing protein [Isosphaeraceae bacterium]